LPPNESYLVWVLSGEHRPEGSFDHIGSPAIGLAKEMSIDIEVMVGCEAWVCRNA
jgi:hypothetical protein